MAAISLNPISIQVGTPGIIFSSFSPQESTHSLNLTSAPNPSKYPNHMNERKDSAVIVITSESKDLLILFLCYFLDIKIIF